MTWFIQRLLARRDILFDLVFWTPFWLVPTLAELDEGQHVILRGVAVGIAASALLAATANLIGRRRRYFYLAMGIGLWLGSALYIAYLVVGHSQISVFGLVDVTEFATGDQRQFGYITGLSDLPPWLIGLCIPFVALAWRWRDLTWPVSLRYTAILAALFLVPLPMKVAECTLLVHCSPRAFWARSLYPTMHYPPAAAYIAATLIMQVRAAIAGRPPSLPPIIRADAGPRTLTLIVVVGETFNRNHMGLYGYCRPTTPNLSAHASEIHAFRDVVSELPLTAFAVPAALVTHGLRTRHGASDFTLIDILNAAGYSTYWISDQTTSGYFSNTITQLTTGARHKVWLNGGMELQPLAYKSPLDDSLLAPLTLALRDTAARKAIFLNVNGAHWTYQDRFPKNYLPGGFTPFTGHRTPAQKEIIDNYDRAIHYVDENLWRIISSARAGNGDTAVVIFGDHGEEAYDQVNWHGHSFPDTTRNMLEIPLIVWLSPSLRAHRPDLDTALSRVTGERLDIAHISPLVLDLAGLDVAGLPQSRRPLSPDFKPGPRLSSGHNYDMDHNLGVTPVLEPLCGVSHAATP